MKTLMKLVLSVLVISGAFTAQASGGFQYDKAKVNRGDYISMQSGAKLYINYCLGCHSLKYQRYGRMAEDLQIPEEMVIQNMMFTGNKIGALMKNNMPVEDAGKWFGTPPPDLSLVVRAKGADFLYTYLRGFYQDETRPYGVNNIAFQDVGMPHVLESLQGLQKKTTDAVFQEDIIFNATHVMNSAQAKIKKEGADVSALEKEISDAEHATHDASAEVLKLRAEKKYFELASQGQMDAESYDEAVMDIVNFLDYVSEPIKTKRMDMGVWVILFLFILFISSYFLKKEYWKDVH